MQSTKICVPEGPHIFDVESEQTPPTLRNKTLRKFDLSDLHIYYQNTRIVNTASTPDLQVPGRDEVRREQRELEALEHREHARRHGGGLHRAFAGRLQGARAQRIPSVALKTST